MAIVLNTSSFLENLGQSPDSAWRFSQVRFPGLVVVLVRARFPVSVAALCQAQFPEWAAVLSQERLPDEAQFPELAAFAAPLRELAFDMDQVRLPEWAVDMDRGRLPV